MSWQTVPQPRTCNSRASVSVAAAGPSDDTCPWVGRAQLTTTFVGDQLTVGGQVRWSHTGQWQVDQSGHLKVQPTPNYLDHIPVTIVPWLHLVNDTDLCCSPKSAIKSTKPPILAFKIIQGMEFGANREPVYDFLLVINSNIGPKVPL